MTPAMPPRAAVADSLFRLARLGVHLARGLWIVQTRYARLAPAEQDRALEGWSRRLLAILRVRVAADNAPAVIPDPCLLVSNHVSWLDIFAVYAVAPSLFVAKSDIRGWPLVGRLVARVGTLFIERGSRRHVRATNERVVAALAGGRLVSVCPEGTTTDGRAVKHFHAALLQPAIDAGATVLPVALRYRERDGGRTGEQTDAAAYVGDMSFVESIWRIAREPGLEVELRFTAAIDARGRHRRELAAMARELIARELGLPLAYPAVRDTAPGTDADLPDGSPSARRPTRSPYPAPADPA
jgi:1-acyl-sn-glycerol-3-phosphate acyltransferase